MASEIEATEHSAKMARIKAAKDKLYPPPRRSRRAC